MTGVPTDAQRPSAFVVLGRALRARCPACGEGRIFEHPLSSPLRFRGRATCAACGWRLERGPGHWVGGTEINILATYGIAVPLFTAVVLLFGLSAVTLTATALFTVAFPLLTYRHSRALFFALDYAIDPTPDPSEAGPRGPSGDPRDHPEPDAPPPPPAPRAPSPSPSREPVLPAA